MTQNTEISQDVQQVGQALSWREVWIQALTRPSVATYQSLIQAPQASPKRAYGWIALSALITFLISAMGTLLWGTLGEAEGMGGVSSILCGLPVAAVLAVLGVAIMAGVSNLIARLFGGAGTYSALVYAFAAYLTPLSLISGVLSLVPILGVFLAPLPGLYGLVLNVIAVKAVHKFSWWKAVVSSVAVLLGIVVIVAVIVIMLLILLGPAIQGVFETITMEMQ
jgi:MFS family permease